MIREAAWQGEPVFVRLTPGPQLFVDDFLIAQSTNLRRTTHQPRKHPEPVISNAGGDSPVLYMKVDRNPENGRFRAWYNSIRVSGPPPSHHYEISHRYTESEDGIHWRGSAVVHTPHPGSDFSLFLTDGGTGSPTPAERYRLAVYYAGKGMWASHSADGITFESYPGNPVIPCSLDDTIPADSPDYRNVIADIIDGCWDPVKRQYLVGCGVGEGGYRGKAVRNFEGRRRCVGVSTSRDFRTWETPRIVVRPEPSNGLEEFYGFKPLVRGNLYLGFLRVLHDEGEADPSLPAEGVGWTELLSSRDGKAWTRYQEVFIDRSPVPGAYDHAMAWFGDSVQVGDREYLYYGGYAEGHKRGPRQMGLAFLRKNGFVSRDAGHEVGYLSTPPLIIEGSAVTVNAAVAGEMRARVTDGNGQPLQGFGWQDCRPLHGDSLRHPLLWNGGDLSALGRSPVRLEFSLRQAQVYALDVDEALSQP